MNKTIENVINKKYLIGSGVAALALALSFGSIAQPKGATGNPPPVNQQTCAYGYGDGSYGDDVSCGGYGGGYNYGMMGGGGMMMGGGMMIGGGMMGGPGMMGGMMRNLTPEQIATRNQMLKADLNARYNTLSEAEKAAFIEDMSQRLNLMNQHNATLSEFIKSKKK